MSTERLRFRRTERAQIPRQRMALMGVLLVICAGLLMGRSWLRSRAPQSHFVVVEVAGDVPRPGFFPVAPPVTVSAAVAAAGGKILDDAPVPPGARVTLVNGTATVSQMDKRLVFGLPILLNSAPEAALMTVPGIGPSRAEAIIEDRIANGPFASVDDLVRVRGIGLHTLGQIRPFLAVESADPVAR